MSENDYFDVSPQQRRRKEIDQLYRDKFFSTNPCSEVVLTGTLTSNCISNISNSIKGTTMNFSSTSKKIIVTLKNTETTDKVMISLPFNETVLALIDQMEIVETGERYSSLEASGVRASKGTKSLLIVSNTDIKPSKEIEEAIKAKEETQRNAEISMLESRLEALRNNK